MGVVRKKDFNIVSDSLLTVLLITYIVLIPGVPNHLENETEHKIMTGWGAAAPLFPPKIDVRDERDRVRLKTGYSFSSVSIISMPTVINGTKQAE